LGGILTNPETRTESIPIRIEEDRKDQRKKGRGQSIVLPQPSHWEKTVANAGVQAVNTPPILDPMVKVGLGLSSPAVNPTASSQSTAGVTPLPFQTFQGGEVKAPSAASSEAMNTSNKGHTPLVQELKSIHLAPPPELNMGYSVSKDGRSIQVKMTNSITGEVVRSFDIKAADLAKVSKPNIALKGSQIDAQF